MQTLTLGFWLQVLPVGLSCCGAPQDQDESGSVSVEAGELRRPVGSAET